jgi:TonB-dependent SusC/RagA subfamily outer membrane receptor
LIILGILDCVVPKVQITFEKIQTKCLVINIKKIVIMKSLKIFSVALGLLLSISGISAQTVKGKVVDKKSNEPIVGAVVTYSKGGGSVTDVNGEFTVKSEDAGDGLNVSLIGYKAQKIGLDGKTKNLTIRLEEDQTVLNDVVVVGYGTSTREKLTGNVTTINAETLAQYPGSNVLEVLQGRVSGLTLTKNSGVAGAGASINIRGLNTPLGAAVDACGPNGCCVEEGATNTEPLIIIDGIPFINQSISAWEVGAAGAIGPLSTISTSDLERIDVLKDADATAIYGSRGANGVILITTKKRLN